MPEIEIDGKRFQVLNGPDGLYIEVGISIGGKIRYIKKKLHAEEIQARGLQVQDRDL